MTDDINKSISDDESQDQIDENGFKKFIIENYEKDNVDHTCPVDQIMCSWYVTGEHKIYMLKQFGQQLNPIDYWKLLNQCVVNYLSPEKESIEK